MRIGIMLCVGLLAVGSAPASAGIYSDALAKCLVTRTSDTDKSEFVRWIFAGLSASPLVAGMSDVTDKQHDEINRTTAALIDRLILADCRNEAVEAIKYEGPSSFETGFGVLGQVATRSLLTDPVVSQSITAFSQFLDRPKWDAMMKEGGAPIAPPAPPVPAPPR